MENVTIRVRPEILIAKAGELKREVSGMEGDFNQIRELVNHSRNYWLGDAGEAHRHAFELDYEEIEKILRRLNEHPRDLESIALTYMGVEQEVKEVAGSLPGDVIID